MTEISATPMDERHPQDLLTPRQYVADYPHNNVSTLAQRRVAGGGVPFLKPTPGVILYRRGTIEKAEGPEYLNTAQAAAADLT